MKVVRVSDTGGRYSKGIISAEVFTPEQLRYLDEELEKIAAVIANHDEAFVVSQSSTELTDISSTINTIGKFAGKQVWDSTGGTPLWAAAGTTAGVWVDATGATVRTPV